MHKRILLLLLIPLALSLFLSLGVNAAQAEDASAAAEAAAQKAEQIEAMTSELAQIESRLDAIVDTGFVWRWTYDRIKEARAALAADDISTAETLLARAAREAELAYEQIEKAEANWAIAVPK